MSRSKWDNSMPKRELTRLVRDWLRDRANGLDPECVEGMLITERDLSRACMIAMRHAKGWCKCRSPRPLLCRSCADELAGMAKAYGRSAVDLRTEVLGIAVFPPRCTCSQGRAAESMADGRVVVDV